MVAKAKVDRVHAHDKKGTFLCSAVSNPWDCSKRITLHPQADLLIPTPIRLLWEASTTMLKLLREDHSFTYPPLSIVKYSFIQLGELNQRRMSNEVAQVSKRQQEDTKSGYLD